MTARMGRRAFLVATASAVAGALAGCEAGTAAGPRTSVAASLSTSSAPTPSASRSTPPPAPRTTPVAPPESPTDIVPPAAQTPAVVTSQLRTYVPPPLTTVAAPAPHDTITALPGDPAGNGLALTVDDGTDSAVVAAYVAFAKATGVRMTFFVNGDNASWTDNAAALRPLVESGQVQLGNHTWSHPDLRSLSDAEIADELHRNGEFLTATYGVDARPFYRPPYGFHDDRVDRVAAEEGYSTTVLWYGSFADSAAIPETTLLQLADTWVKPGAIVIGHANYPTVTHLYPQLIDLIRQRALHTVTLADVYPPG